MILTMPKEKETISVWLQEEFEYRVWESSRDSKMKVFGGARGGIVSLPNWLAIA